MIVKELRLFKYKRFFLNNITEIVYKPVEHLQIILGANGSGKSSLLKELNPLPADLTRDYNEGGYKYVIIEHLGREYTLSSGYLHKGKHSCILDEIELNPGGTRKVQLELIKEHFNITPNVVDVLLNNDRLTNMSPSTRKSWFTMLSTVDYTYPIGIYNKLKQRHRDMLGGIKLLQEDIIRNEVNNENVDIVLLESNRIHLEKYIEHVTSLYEHNIKLNTTDTVNDMLRHSRELKSLLINNNVSKAKKDKLVQEVEYTKLKILSLSDNIIKIGKEIDVLDKIQSSRDVVNIENELKECNVYIANISKSMYIDVNINMVDVVYDHYTNVVSELMECVNNLTHVEEVRSYTKEKRNDIVQRAEHMEIRYSSLKKRLSITLEELKHTLEHKDDINNVMTCPKCSNVFNSKYDITTHDSLTSNKNKIETELETCKVELDKYNVIINLIKEKENIIHAIKNNIVNTPECSVIWNHIWSVVDINTSSVTSINNLLNKILVDLSNWVKIREYVNRKERLTKELEHVTGLMKLTNEVNKNKLEEYTKTLEEYTIAKNINITIVDNLTKDIKLLTEVEVMYNKLLSNLKDLNKSFTSNVLTLRNKHLTELVNELKGELVKIDHILNNHKQHVNKLTKDKLLLQEYKNKEKVLNYMLRELSPSEGLIARSINSFLNVFITEMNNVINSIWSYNMELLPCDVSDNDLDYKFKVKVNNSEIIEDVSKLSSSMQEIVDLAFRLVFAKYLHLKDTPLYLDEFGRTFDKKHRITAYSVIDKIISSDYKQIFIVSHYESLYGSLRNVDISVINEDNLDLDSSVKYNQVLKIK